MLHNLTVDGTRKPIIIYNSSGNWNLKQVIKVSRISISEDTPTEPIPMEPDSTPTEPTLLKMESSETGDDEQPEPDSTFNIN